jgi:hypothetical protein
MIISIVTLLCSFCDLAGWCNGPTADATIVSCAQRAHFGAPGGEGVGVADKLQLHEPGLGGTYSYGGVMSPNCTYNPDFCSWNTVFIHYRDGASMGSNREHPIPVKFKNGSTGAQLWMRGRPSFDATIADLLQQFGMSNATEVILSGGSAGGLAVYYNLDHLASILGPKVRLTGFPDAGFFLDHQDLKGAYSFRQNFIGADPIWNVTGQFCFSFRIPTFFFF